MDLLFKVLLRYYHCSMKLSLILPLCVTDVTELFILYFASSPPFLMLLSALLTSYLLYLGKVHIDSELFEGEQTKLLVFTTQLLQRNVQKII